MNGSEKEADRLVERAMGLLRRHQPVGRPLGRIPDRDFNRYTEATRANDIAEARLLVDIAAQLRGDSR